LSEHGYHNGMGRKVKTHKERWEQGFAALSKYRRRKGHCCPPGHYRESKFNLGRWVISQRYLKDDLSLERKRRLDKIGFVWNRRDHSWERGFAALAKFKQRERHCCVPILHREGSAQTWKLGFSSAQNKERNVAQTKGAVKQNRLCVESAEGRKFTFTIKTRQRSSSFFGGVLCLGWAVTNTMPMQATKPTSCSVPTKAGAITGSVTDLPRSSDDETVMAT
jgi:hypothetical protein